MLTKNFLRCRRRNELSGEEKQALEDAVSQLRPYGARSVIARENVALHESNLLVEGMVGRYMTARNGEQQLVAVHVVGDFLDLHGFPLKQLDHNVVAITPVKLAMVPHGNLLKLTSTHPHLMRLLWFSTLLDAAIHREWIFKLGRLDAIGRVAHFFCEMNVRLKIVGLSDGLSFDLPMTQSDLADACGLTSVHVNRVLRQLREGKLLTFTKSHAVILDLAGLSRTGEFDPTYLYLDKGTL
jgi:CRP-like cAMP-binding protein